MSLFRKLSLVLAFISIPCSSQAPGTTGKSHRSNLGFSDKYVIKIHSGDGLSPLMEAGGDYLNNIELRISIHDGKVGTYKVLKVMYGPLATWQGFVKWYVQQLSDSGKISKGSDVEKKVLLVVERNSYSFFI